MDSAVLWFALALSLLASVEPMTSVSSSTAKQSFLEEPQDQTVVVGTKAVLPCRVKDKWGELQWTQNLFGLGAHRNLSAYERYTMIGKDEDGDFALKIDPVLLKDEGLYQCQVMGGEDQPKLQSRYANLTVLVPPEPPRIVQGSTLETTEEREIKVECVSTGGKPTARISWLDGHGVLTNGIEHTVEHHNDSKLYTARSVLKIITKKHHHKTALVCRTQHVAESFARTTAVRLEVKYAPRVTVSVVGEKLVGGIVEGSDVRVVCLVDANPLDVNYTWYKDGAKIMATTSEIHLKNVGRSMHGVTVLCRAYNFLGKSEASEVLNITYGPRFRTTPLPMYSADIGSAVTMTCNAEGRPTPHIKWFFINADRNEDETLLGTSPDLTVIADSDRKGRYYCKALVDGFPEVVTETQLFLHGKPEIFSIRSQLMHLEVLVECEAHSLPKHDKVTWSHNGKELPKHDADYDIVEDPLPLGIKSVLHIKSMGERTSGIYNCHVSNAHGTDSESTSIFLIARTETSPVTIVAGVTGGCLVVMVGVVLCWRCKTRSVIGDSERDELCRQTSGLSSNVSVTKLNLPSGSLVSCPVSETDSERVVDNQSPARPVSLRLPFTHTNNHTHRISTVPHQSDRRQDQRNSSYVSYGEVSMDDSTLVQINDVEKYCSPGNVDPVNNLLPLDVNFNRPPLSRCTSVTPADAGCVSAPYGMPSLQCSNESMLQLHTGPARTDTSSGYHLCTATALSPSTQSFRPPCNTAKDESDLLDASTSQEALPPFQTSTTNQGLLGTIV